MPFSMVHCASSSTTTARANSTEAAYSGYTAVNSTGCLGLNGQRIGEANHPGPLEFLTIGTTNPGGLRNKEQLAVEQGSGIWSYSETHLSKVTQISAAKALKFHAANEGRHLRVHFGAPAALRARSSWAGTWTGVACTSDHSSKVLQVPWPNDFWASGRVLATQHFVGHHVITVVTIYGLPRGPTWPKAAELTNSLLEYITKEFVVGYQGIIIINGDFNYSPHELPCFDVWRAYGFCSAQDYANHRWHQPVAPTCKGATERDLLWMSPMAAALCQKVGVNDVFHDHSSVYVQLQVEVLPHVMRTWPRPREVPWQQVPIAEWHQHCESLDLPVPTDPTLAMKELAISFETSLTGYVPDLHEAKLSSAHCGRAQRLQPARQTTTPLTCRASRPGEAKLVDDKVGKAVILWFKQLRRIQSFRHASCAGHLHHEAVQYRIELWTAIKRAKGFNGSFSDWWLSQEFAMGLGPLPEQPPGAHQAVLIYQAFHHVFRSFEQWHLRQRQQVLQAKYDKTMKALFHDLRKPRPDQVDSFWDTRSYEVAAVKADTKGILFTQPVPSHEDGQWFFQGQSLAVHGSIEELLILDFLPEVAPGDHIDFHYHTVTTDQVHQSLMDFWQPRWNREELQQADTWSRMINFVKAYMPKIPLTLPTLTVEMWREALKRFKPQAARGADGWARLDLLNMSRPHTNQLLRLLTAIENRQMTWPDQLLEGLVIAIAKCDGAHRPNEFRPIVLLSIIYRCWASLRSRQMLQQLEPFIHADAHGFLPSREPAQTWMQIQAAVETSLQSELPMAGIGTDFVKAFNCIQRRPLWFLAEALGIPDGLLWPWKEFASRFTRRFMVCNQVSGPMRSTQGYAEGCPLSVLAMALIDWGYQVYQYQYAPQVRHLSFVDNISMLARQAHLVAWAFFTLRAFLTMWGLSLDLDKTYAWGTTAEIRLQLSQLGIRVVQDFSELGGALSFTAAHRVRFFVNRGANLQDKWQQLRRSRAPIAQKLHAVPMVFWAKALHGALSCTAAERHIHKLRTQAVRHLGLQLAGSNPMLRLSLACPHNADPGFYQLKQVIFDFRRLCRKSPDLLTFWRIFMDRFNGVLRDGPFSKLVMMLNTIGWQILSPPLFQDHDGFTFDMLALDKGALHRLLLEAWFQHVAAGVKHKTMADLEGIDLELTLLDHEKQTALDLARVRALQTGAFTSSWQHAKYDKTKQPICQCCLLPDTQQHWLRCPRFASQRAETGDSFDWVDNAPQCLALHLLVPRSSYVLPLKKYFIEIPDSSESFLSLPRTGVRNHVFTDGSCFKGVVSITSRASWAVVNSTTGQTISHGCVPGLQQTIGRAELWACISAIAFAVKFDADVTIWTDSANTCRRVCQALHDPAEHWDGENSDLWTRMMTILAQTRNGQVEVRWTPSHIDDLLCENPTEEYLAVWNEIADQHAVNTNRNRGLAFTQLCQTAEEFYQLWRKRLQALRHFYLQVANTTKEEQEIIDLTDEPDVLVQKVFNETLGDTLPVNWQNQLSLNSESLAQPVEFVLTLFSKCIAEEPMQANFVAISFVELTLWSVHKLNVQFPVEQTTSGQWIYKSPFEMLLRPTLASLTLKVRQSFKSGLRLLGLDNYLCFGLNRQVAGIAIPVDGLILSIPAAIHTEICNLTNSFFPRMLRKAADVAKPC